MSHITSEDIAAGPPGSVQPLSVCFTSNGETAMYLFPDDKGQRQIFAVIRDENGINEVKKYLDFSDVASGDALSLQEQLRRERMRLFTKGVASFEILPDCESVVIPANGQIYQYSPKKSLTVYYDGGIGDAVDPHISPDGNKVAFVVNDDLFFVSTVEGHHKNPIRLTNEGQNPGITCGLADFVAQEEMNRYRGFWWSPDSSSIAFTIVNETMVPEYKILHQGKADPKHDETHRYPFAGEKNPHVRLAVLKVAESSADVSPYVVVDLFPTPVGLSASAPIVDPEDYYLGRVGWWPDGSVMAQVQDRDQQILHLLRIDPISGSSTVLLREETNVWINLHDLLHTFSPAWSSSESPREDGDFYFLWGSERTGFSQLYLYKYSAGSQTARCLLGGRPIGGGGDWVVESIDDVDEVNEVVYLSGNRGDPTQRHAFRVRFGSGPNSSSTSCEVEALTTSPGWHSVTVSSKRGVFVDCFNSISAPPRATLHPLPPLDVSASSFVVPELLVLHDNAVSDARLGRLQSALRIPTIETIRSADDEVDLICAVYTPDESVYGPGPYPTIMYVYGGPHVQIVSNCWRLRSDLRSQKFAQDGFLVIRCDNRASSRRGLAFEGAVKWDMGNVEVLDQAAAVEAFAARGLVNPARVGMFGWSYGGYMSAMSLCRAPDVFRCAVAGAPVTSWDGYDTHYTERYMGRPQVNVAGYTNSSVMSHVKNMTGRLLLVHGLIDENVHFRHTARLINALIEHRKRYDLVLFPCERHGPHKLQDKVYLEDRMLDFFKDHLQPAPGAVDEDGAEAVNGGRVAVPQAPIAPPVSKL